VAAPPCATCYETVDTLGSLRAVTDGFGNTIALHDYMPFGEELATANRELNGHGPCGRSTPATSQVSAPAHQMHTPRFGS
jgi:hypothetical protein